MKKGIPKLADRLLHIVCIEKSNEIAILKLEGSASTQMEIRRIADRIVDYALEPGTSFGIIEVLFPDKPWKGLEELYLQAPTLVSFRNFIPEKDDIDRNTMLVKHLIVVSNWSNEIKIFKATIENDKMYLMLYTAVKKPKI